MNTATATINTKQNVTLAVRDIDRSLDYYHGKLGFAVLTQNSDCAQLQIAPGYVLNLCLQHAATSTSGLRDRCIRFTRQGIDKLLRCPQLLARPFMAQRSVHAAKLPLQLQDPDGNRLGVCVDTPEVIQKPAAKKQGGRSFRNGLIRVFSDLAAFHGYRR